MKKSEKKHHKNPNAAQEGINSPKTRKSARFLLLKNEGKMRRNSEQRFQ